MRSSFQSGTISIVTVQLMEMDTNQSEAAQMEANAYQEDHVLKSKEAVAHTVEAETQLKQHGDGMENAQNTKRGIQNGEY